MKYKEKLFKKWLQLIGIIKNKEITPISTTTFVVKFTIMFIV
jgi:hypothetical protein